MGRGEVAGEPVGERGEYLPGLDSGMDDHFSVAPIIQARESVRLFRPAGVQEYGSGLSL